jgi:ABC-2 type transport system permease protein
MLWALVRKDLQLFLADRRAVIMHVVVPIVIAAFVGFVFARSAGDQPPSRVAVRVVDQDGSPLSRAVADALAADRFLDAKPEGIEPAR